MLTVERRKRIRELLSEYMHVDVSSLCTFLNVSPATIRRDLDALEQEGFLLKTYGGATLNENSSISGAKLKDTSDPYEHQKKSIAAFAVKIIQDGDVIFLSGGLIPTYIARYLQGFSSLSVITNNVTAAHELNNASGINTVLIGGDIIGSRGDCETCGEMACSALSGMFFNKSFLAFDGVSQRRGYTVDNMNKTKLFKTAISNSDDCFAVFDSNTLDHTSLHVVADLSAIRRVIGPIEMAEDYKRFFLTNGVQLYDITMN